MAQAGDQLGQGHEHEPALVQARVGQAQPRRPVDRVRRQLVQAVQRRREPAPWHRLVQVAPVHPAGQLLRQPHTVLAACGEDPPGRPSQRDFCLRKSWK